MIEGLLQYSRVDTRGDPFESVGLDSVLADVRDDLQVRIEETDAEVTAENHSGTGIELALCERLLERHGGDFWVDSKLGEGSTFTFTLSRKQNQHD